MTTYLKSTLYAITYLSVTQVDQSRTVEVRIAQLYTIQ